MMGRTLPAAFSVLFVVLSYLCARLARLSKISASLVAMLMLLEPGFLVESRLILTDSFLFFFHLWQSPARLQWCTSGLSRCRGCLCYCAAVWPQPVLSASSLLRWARSGQWVCINSSSSSEIQGSLAVRYCCILWYAPCCGSSPIVVIFLSMFYIHTVLLPYHGSGDAYMSAEYQQSIVAPGDEPYSGPLTVMDRVFEQLHTMHAVNMGLDIRHPFESSWKEWPTCQAKAVLYYQEFMNGAGNKIYCMCNPIVYWFALFGGMIGFATVCTIALARGHSAC